TVNRLINRGELHTCNFRLRCNGAEYALAACLERLLFEMRMFNGTGECKSERADLVDGYHGFIIWEFMIYNWVGQVLKVVLVDRKSTRLNSSHVKNSYAVFCLIK